MIKIHCPYDIDTTDEQAVLKIIKGYFVLNIFNFYNAKSSFASALYRKRG